VIKYIHILVQPLNSSPATLSFIAASASLRSDRLIARRIPTGQLNLTVLHFLLTISHLCRYPSLSNRVSSPVASRHFQSSTYTRSPSQVDSTPFPPGLSTPTHVLVSLHHLAYPPRFAFTSFPLQVLIIMSSDLRPPISSEGLPASCRLPQSLISSQTKNGRIA